MVPMVIYISASLSFTKRIADQKVMIKFLGDSSESM